LFRLYYKLKNNTSYCQHY